MIYCVAMNSRAPCNPSISYRTIRPSDREVLEKIHDDLFPISYEKEFFDNVVHHHDVVSWGAVDSNRPNGQNDELIGFITARVVKAKESEIEEMFRFDKSRSDQSLIYIQTLGVVESYRNLGIATSLIQQVINYASNMPNCGAVYLHVISYNKPAIHLYQKMLFIRIRKLRSYYFINHRNFDAYLFIYYVDGGHSPCSPLELVTLLATYTKRGLKSVSSRVWKKDEKFGQRQVNDRDKCCFMPMTQSRRSIAIEGPESDHEQ